MNHDDLMLLATGALACLGVLSLVPVARRFALARGITDRPKAGKAHASPTPYLGGLVIAIVVLGCFWLLPRRTSEVVVLVTSATIVAALGLADDLRPLRPLARVGVEVMAATLVFSAGIRFHLVGGVGDYVLTVGWLVLLTNSFNLLDNLDGAASVVILTVSLGCLAEALIQGQVLVGGLAAVVGGACIGFLGHNWHPARIFMGDAGSLFLGFVVSAVVLELRFPVGAPAKIGAVVLIVGMALFDTILVVISRVRAHRPVANGWTDHTSHRLLRVGLNTPMVAVGLGLWSTVFVALGVTVGQGVIPAATALVPAVVATLLLVGFLLVPVYPRTPKQGRGGPEDSGSPEDSGGRRDDNGLRHSLPTNPATPHGVPMAWCHEFGRQVASGCDEAIGASADTCMCDACGTRCTGQNTRTVGQR
jgi:UDP-GlcNAc:undecaprenyl-phosphate GlcNAc-1-phosphate transferase